MLVEINLLPERERKKSAFIILFAAMVAVIFIVAAVYILQGNSTKTETVSVDREYSTTQKVMVNITSSSPPAAATSVTQLENAIKWANEYPIKTVPVMNMLTALLPERGFIQSFAYTDAGTINLTVQFDTESEAAYFLTHLTDSKWIEDASITSLTTAPLTTATSTNTIGAAINQASSSTNSTGTVNNQENTSTIVNNDNSNNTTITSTVPSATSSSALAAGNQPGTNVSVQNSQASGSVQSSGTSASQADGGASNNVQPRYIGQFDITLNKDVLLQEEKKSNQSGEGVTAP